MTTFNPQLCQHTPTVSVSDNRGLSVRDIRYNHAAVADAIVELISRHEFDPAGRLTSSADPRLVAARQTDASVSANFRYLHDLAGSALRTDSLDAGWQLALHDAEGRPVWQTNARGNLLRHEYESNALPGRPLAVYEQTGTAPERAAERFVYAGNAAADKQFNLAGQVARHYDTAGVVRLTALALGGAVLNQERQLLANPELASDWSGGDENLWKKALGATVFTTLTTADSTGVSLTQTDARGNQQRYAYDRAGQLMASWLTLKGKAEQPVIKALSYSAAGQKLREEHGNGCATDYTYEPQTQRLLGCKTSRTSGLLQDLRYDYDPVGNLLSIRNDAEATRFYRNQKIDPENTYTYDALYQLISATGYESAANQPQAAQNSSWQSPIPTDRTQYVNYTRNYQYDNAGNLLQLRHAGASSYTHSISLSDRSNHGVFNPQNTALTRQQIEAKYDAAGNQLDLNNGTALSWNTRNLLAQATVVVRDAQTFDGETYLYDGGSMRVQKCTRSQAGSVAHQHAVTYLPGLELHSKTQNGVEKEGWQVITAGAAGHAQVRALCWTAGKPAGLTDRQLRFSIDNLTGSSLLELDDSGQIISQEAYFPFGGTAVSATRNQVEADYKTLRYCGKERDATGLYYYGYRYYQPWAGRWLSADPAGTIDGLNLYRMVRNNPVTLKDEQGLAPGDDKEKSPSDQATGVSQLPFPAIPLLEIQEQSSEPEASGNSREDEIQNINASETTTWDNRYYLFVDRVDDGPMESGMLYAHKIQKVPGANIFTLGEAPEYTDFDRRIGDCIEGLSSLKNTNHLASIGIRDRLDVMGHGHPDKIAKFDGTKLTATALADELFSHGLSQVGILKIQACNILRNSDSFLTELKNSLTLKGIKVGYLAGTRKYISQTAKTRGHRDNPAGSPSPKDERFRYLKGNADISFSATRHYQ